MIRLQGISKRFGPKALFEDVNWHIKPGQSLGLIGPNGAGKTTLIRIITGETGSDGGEVRFTRGVTMGYLPQEIAALSGTGVREEARKGIEAVLKLREELRVAEEGLATNADAEAMTAYAELQSRYDALDGFTADARVDEVLQGLGFKRDDFERDCGELSGGWQMRVALARLLLTRPDVLLLDEPTNHLDLESVVWLENFLTSFPGSLVFISHDRRFLNRLCSHIAELGRDGVDVYTGNFDAYLVQVEERQALLERQQQNQQKRIAELERFVDRFKAKASKAKQAQSRVKMLEKIDRIELRARERTINFELSPAPHSGRVMMTLENIHQAYGDLRIYEGLDVELLRGQKIALVGPNGAGKSTLLKLFAGVVPYQRGQRILGHKAKLYYFAQHQIEVLNLDKPVLEEAMADANLLPQKVRSILGAFLFDKDAVKKQVRVLSGGEKNRLALVKMLMTPANMLLLDEPTNHLDMASRAVLQSALAEYDGTIVFISHDRHFIDAVADQVWEVEAGRVTPFLGSYTEYQSRVARGDRPEPLPLHGGTRMPQRAKTVDESEPVAAPKQGKEARRAEAEARKQRAAATRGLKKAAEKAEEQVMTLEGEIEALRALQADPAHYDDPAAVRETAQAVAALDAKLEAAYADWEAAGAALEEAEAQFE